MTQSSLAASGSSSWQAPINGAPAWLHEWFSPQPRHVRIIDAVTAIVTMVIVGMPFALRPDWSYYFSWAAVPVFCIFTVALAIRRMSTWLAFILVNVGVLIKWMLGLPLHGMDAALLIMLYTCAARGSRLLFVLSGVAAIVWPLIEALFATLFPVPLPIVHEFTGRASLGAEAALLPFLGFSITLILISLMAWLAGGLLRVQLDSNSALHAAELAEIEYQRAQEQLVVEQERNYIARDMHDIVAHSLAVVVAQADGGRYLMKSSPQAVEPVLVTIADTARDALVDVRGLLAKLRHHQHESVRKTTEDLPLLYERVQGAGLRLDISETGTVRSLGTAAEVAVFRLVQEGLTNALKYGDHREPVLVELNWDDSLRIRIRNKVDRSPNKATGSGHGLIGMRERLLIVNGHVSAAARDDHWEVRAEVPYPGSNGKSASPGLPLPENVDTNPIKIIRPAAPLPASEGDRK